jgi:hypothetical protein
MCCCRCAGTTKATVRATARTRKQDEGARDAEGSVPYKGGGNPTGKGHTIRNLTPMQLSHFRGLHYKADKKIITNASGKNQFKEVERQSDAQPQSEYLQGSTATRLAKQYKVSKNIIDRDSKIAAAIMSMSRQNRPRVSVSHFK